MTDHMGPLLEDGYALLQEEEARLIDKVLVTKTVLDAMGSHPQAGQFAAMAQAFHVFRQLHDMDGDTARKTLLGDYFFSLFSKLMIPLDSPWLIDQFAQRLEDECEAKTMESYDTFLKRICKTYVNFESEPRCQK